MLKEAKLEPSPMAPFILLEASLEGSPGAREGPLEKAPCVSTMSTGQADPADVGGIVAESH